MESTGEANKIQISQETADVLAREPMVKTRLKRRPGVVDVKGQGRMRTWWLLTNQELANGTRSSQSFDVVDMDR